MMTSRTGGFLFDDFPQSSLRAASLLEALASAERQRLQRMSRFDDDDENETAAVERAARFFTKTTPTTEVRDQSWLLSSGMPVVLSKDNDTHHRLWYA